MKIEILKQIGGVASNRLFGLLQLWSAKWFCRLGAPALSINGLDWAGDSLACLGALYLSSS
jgi:hypothetical protein